MLPPRFTPKKGPPRLSSRQAAVAQWQGVEASEHEKALRTRTRSSSEVLDRVLKQIRFDRRHAESEIARSWSHVAGADVAAHAQPTGLRNGTLFVNVDSHVWREELVRYRNHEVLERLQTAFGSDLILRISWKVG